jgi:hypothetical protein
MANYRQIHVSIWKDGWFIELPPEEKLLFVYLFSNELASLGGLYELPLRVVPHEIGLPPETINSALEKFERAGKIHYKDGIMWVVNMRKYNRGGARVHNRMMQDVDEIPDCELKRRFLTYYGDAEDDTEGRAASPTETRDRESTIVVENEANPTPIPERTFGIAVGKPQNPTGTPKKESAIAVKCNEMNQNEKEHRRRRSRASPRVIGAAEAERLFQKITGMPTFPASSRADDIERLIAIHGQKGEETVTHCMRFYYEWVNVRRYSKSNTGWLDWAVAGEIPIRRGVKKSRRNANDPQRQVIVNYIQERVHGEE